MIEEELPGQRRFARMFWSSAWTMKDEKKPFESGNGLLTYSSR